MKTDTDLFLLARDSIQAVSISCSKDHFAVCCSDWGIRLFNVNSGRMTRLYEGDLGHEKSLPPEECQERVAAERNYRLAQRRVSVCFDETGSLIIIPTIWGIRFYSVSSGNLLRAVGRVEKHQRFNSVALLQRTHPMLVATAFDRPRFYLFTCKPPDTANRDIMNEKLTKDRRPVSVVPKAADISKTWPSIATIHTTMGGIKIEMFASECPLAVENFVTHARRGYFDNIRIHRVVRDFCIQTGDPSGSGIGGESIWGGYFDDEFPENGHRFDCGGMVGMANSGKNTNGSQFFVTTVATEHLNGKHTCWGRVIDGMENVKAMELVDVDSYSHPLLEVKIVNITFS
jgi:peptidylprolyl isomerase domain and WD repeat-containing protein 1